LDWLCWSERLQRHQDWRNPQQRLRRRKSGGEAKMLEAGITERFGVSLDERVTRTMFGQTGGADGGSVAPAAAGWQPVSWLAVHR
jgi:hypothetical protein